MIFKYLFKSPFPGMRKLIQLIPYFNFSFPRLLFLLPTSILLVFPSFLPTSTFCDLPFLYFIELLLHESLHLSNIAFSDLSRSRSSFSRSSFSRSFFSLFHSLEQAISLQSAIWTFAS